MWCLIRLDGIWKLKICCCFTLTFHVQPQAFVTTVLFYFFIKIWKKSVWCFLSFTVWVKMNLNVFTEVKDPDENSLMGCLDQEQHGEDPCWPREYLLFFFTSVVLSVGVALHPFLWPNICVTHFKSCALSCCIWGMRKIK